MNKKLRIGTLFSGIGAAEFALKRLGIPHEIVFACDNGELSLKGNDEIIQTELAKLKTVKERKAYLNTLLPKKVNFVRQLYLANYEMDENDFHHDVRYMDATEYKGKVDLLVGGGSPCQSFTLLGYQKGLEEARGTLFYEFARIVKEVQPQVFIYENVQGLTKHDRGRTWEVVQRVFQSLNYHIHFKILDAVEQGIPQKRRRIFVVGFKETVTNFEFPEPQPLKYTMQDFLQDNVAFGGFISSGSEIKLKKGGELVDEKYFLSEKILPGIMSTSIPRGHIRKALRVLNSLRICATRSERALLSNPQHFSVRRRLSCGKAIGMLCLKLIPQVKNSQSSNGNFSGIVRSLTIRGGYCLFITVQQNLILLFSNAAKTAH